MDLVKELNEHSRLEETLKTTMKNKIKEEIDKVKDRQTHNSVFITRMQHEIDAIEHILDLTDGRLTKETIEELQYIIDGDKEYMDVVMRNQERLTKRLDTLYKQHDESNLMI